MQPGVILLDALSHNLRVLVEHSFAVRDRLFVLANAVGGRRVGGVRPQPVFFEVREVLHGEVQKLLVVGTARHLARCEDHDVFVCDAEHDLHTLFFVVEAVVFAARGLSRKFGDIDRKRIRHERRKCGDNLEPLVMQQVVGAAKAVRSVDERPWFEHERFDTVFPR